MMSLLVETSSNRCQKVVGKCSESFQNGKMCHISSAEHSRIYHLSLLRTMPWFIRSMQPDQQLEALIQLFPVYTLQ